MAKSQSPEMHGMVLRCSRLVAMTGDDQMSGLGDEDPTDTWIIGHRSASVRASPSPTALP